MTELLFISYYLPPVGVAGAQRAKKLLKYLPLYDISPVILTANPLFVFGQKNRKDKIDFPNLYHTFSLDLFWLYKICWGLKLSKLVTWLQTRVFFPDPQRYWHFFAKRITNKIMRTHNIKLCYVSAGPFSSLGLGEYVKSRWGIPFFAEFRDEWTNNPIRRTIGYPQKTTLIEKKAEERILRSCSALVVLNNQMKTNFMSQYPFLQEKPLLVMPNSYDEHDFLQAEKNLKMHTRKYLRMVYIGTFYNHQNPKLMFKALARYFHDHNLNSAQIQIHIYGKNKPAFVLGELMADRIFSSASVFHGHIPYYKVIRQQLTADVLLLFISPTENCEVVQTTKLFEYLRAKKPILAIIPPKGEAAELINKCKSGWIFDSGDEAAIYRGFDFIFQKWSAGELAINPDIAEIEKYEQAKQVALLSEFINKIIT